MIDARVLEDFKSKLVVEKVLDALGVDYTVKGDHAWLNCPFHEETTPSFHIELERGLYYCFGCSEKGGDMIAFVMGSRKLGFVQAVEFLSQLMDLPLPQGLAEIDKELLVRRKLVHQRLDYTAEIFRLVYTDVYRFMLDQCSIGPAYEYLYGRGIPNADAVVNRQYIRVVEDYDKVSKALLAKFSLDRLVAAGVMNEKRNLIFYSHRLLIPFFDGDEIVYVSARSYPNEVKPKYLNLADVRIPGLYNVNAARGNKVVFLCEGLTDTMALVGRGLPAVGVAGANNVEAEAVGVLRDRKVILAMDNDSAGRMGLARLYHILPYIAESIYEYVKPEKDILEHVLAPDGVSRLEEFYRGVSEGTVSPSSGLPDVFGTGLSDGAQR